MARIARVVLPGTPHHVTQRGNNSQDVFFDDVDRETYLHYLREQSEAYGLLVVGYCLMRNHVHLVVVPRGAESLATGVGRTHYRYAQHVNRRHERSGHLWQNRYFSCVMDDGHAVAALLYVERNPVRAGLVERPWDYRWSSAGAHVGRGDPSGVIDVDLWWDHWTPQGWRSSLEAPPDELLLETIRRCTSCGRPFGAEGFVRDLEAALGRRLKARHVGRPKIGEP
jgi:REP-associated tyrosine transposase